MKQLPLIKELQKTKTKDRGYKMIIFLEKYIINYSKYIYLKKAPTTVYLRHNLELSIIS